MRTKIPFHRPTQTKSIGTTLDVFRSDLGKNWVESCKTELFRLLGVERLLLTPSCTAALELCALLLDLQPEDEVILPSFTFVSSANPFVMRGARLVFVDIDPSTMNVSADCIEAAIGPRTKAILVMHYGGVGCDMPRIMDIAGKHGLWVIEDAAHCIGAKLNGQQLGTFGHLSTFSFHQSKNIHCYEGGALVVNDDSLWARAQIISEKGTNRQAFLEGKSNRYTWVDIGVSATMSDLSAAFLWDQLQHLPEIEGKRSRLYQRYDQELSAMTESGKIERLLIPSNAQSNHHVIGIKCRDREARSRLIAELLARDVHAYFHYVPLHSSPAGLKYGHFWGEDKYTTLESERLLRLPIFDSMKESEVDRVVELLFELV